MPKTLAAATVDRLLHHAHVLVCDTNKSYRLAQATAGVGVTPLIPRPWGISIWSHSNKPLPERSIWP